MYEQRQLRTAGVPEARQKRDEKEIKVEERKTQIKKKKKKNWLARGNSNWSVSIKKLKLFYIDWHRKIHCTEQSHIKDILPHELDHNRYKETNKTHESLK